MDATGMAVSYTMSVIWEVESSLELGWVWSGVVLQVDAHHGHQLKQYMAHGHGLHEEAELVPGVAVRFGADVLFAVLDDQPDEESHLCHDEDLQL